MMLGATNIREYFREAMHTAQRERGIELTEPAQVYLINLMVEFMRSGAAFAGAERGEKPAMVTLLTRAQEAEPSEALRIYKHLGDTSLYLSGFFAESVERELVSRDYYVSIGGQAYQSVASLMRSSAAFSSVLFEELAARFDVLVELLESMSLHGERTSPEKLSDGKILELIDRYRRTGRREILEALRAQGVVLRPGLGSEDDAIH